MTLIRHRLSPPGYIPGTHWTIGNEFGNVVLNRGVYAFDYFYYLMREWFVENGWAGRINEYDFRERLFLQRDSSRGSELWVYWRMKKPSTDKLFYFECDINWHVLGLSPTEVVVKDRKLKANKGETEMKYWMRLVLDQEYAKSFLFRNFGKFMLDRILRDRWESVRRDLIREGERFHEAMKTYFDIETYLEEPELHKFYATRGLE